MTTPLRIDFRDVAPLELDTLTQPIVLLIEGSGKLDSLGRKIDTATKKAVSRVLASDAWSKLSESSEGGKIEINFPVGLASEKLVLVAVPNRLSVDGARKLGASLAQFAAEPGLAVLANGVSRVEDIALGVALRSYRFTDHKTAPVSAQGTVVFYLRHPEVAARAASDLAALAEGIYFARDLVNAPANVLTTTEFASRIKEMEEIGLEVEILEEAELEALGMGLLLAVGKGSVTPTKVAVMQWKGTSAEHAPLALIGKGVVFDTGGISLKPPAGMEEMITDMGGAALVCGVMRTLALRRAAANVVAVVGLVENMPSGIATRPGDIIRSMKGDTVEINNTDAEGRLLLADVMWYAQERFAPKAMIDFATLTGNIILALGTEYAGLFANDDRLAAQLTGAGAQEGEAMWRMPLSPAFDATLASRGADLRNSGGRPGGAIIAARFLNRFVKEGVAWAHLDIAGVASMDKDMPLGPKGATGWGVATLNRMIAETYELRG